MPRSSNNKRNKKSKTPPQMPSEMPNHLKRDHMVYVDGTIVSKNRGFYVVEGDNQMNFLARADKLEKLYRLQMLVGDRVTIEVDLRCLDSSSERQRGRIVWRYKHNI